MATPKLQPDPIIAQMIIEMIGDGVRMPEIYASGIVARSTFYAWKAGDPEFAARVAEARREFYFEQIESTVHIAETTPDPKRARVIIHAIHEAARLLDPDRYGQRMKVDTTVKQATYALPANASPQEASRAYDDFIKA